MGSDDELMGAGMDEAMGGIGDVRRGAKRSHDGIEMGGSRLANKLARSTSSRGTKRSHDEILSDMEQASASPSPKRGRRKPKMVSTVLNPICRLHACQTFFIEERLSLDRPICRLHACQTFPYTDCTHAKHWHRGATGSLVTLDHA